MLNRLLPDSHHFTDLSTQRKCRLAAVFPIERPVEVAEAHKPSLLQIEGEGGSNNHLIDLGPIGRASEGNRILQNRTDCQVLDPGVDQREGRTRLPLSCAQLGSVCRGKNQRRPDTPSAPGLFEGK